MIKHIFFTTLSLIGYCAFSYSAFGQYPIIPKSLEDSAAVQMEIIQKRSDSAWKIAWPIVQAETNQGRSFVPWASKPDDLVKATIPAFPGAEGAGAYTPGGRGGKVLVVSNLNDDGIGSFRWACEQGGARIIVFNIAGIIHLKTPINIRAPYISIFGQSAPGDGICIAGESVLIDTHDIIIRFVRFRRGATDVTRRDDALGGNPVGNIMIDHVSASWGLDENMSIYRHVYDRQQDGKGEKLPTVNVTIQNSIFSEALDTYNHAFGSTIGGHKSTFMRNLWANNIARNPSVGMDGDFGFVNNVVFNWWNRSADGGDDKSKYNFINNYFKPGPITAIGQPISYRILKPESGRAHKDTLVFGKAYVNGNIVDDNATVTKDNWDGGVQPDVKNNLPIVLANLKADKPFQLARFKVLSAEKSFDYVLKNAGAFLPKRDAVDQRIVETVKTGKIKFNENAPEFAPKFIKRRLPKDSYKKGIIYDVNQVGGYPKYNGSPYLDSDKDGIPDDYEKKHGLNPGNPSDASIISKNGYSNIENYVNSLVPIERVVAKEGKFISGM